MKVVFSGVAIPQNGHNHCHVEECENDPVTAVWMHNRQTNVCAWHLKVKLESGEWEIARKETRG